MIEEQIIQFVTFLKSSIKTKDITLLLRKRPWLFYQLSNCLNYLGSSNIPTVIYTDHNPLVFLARMYKQNQSLMHWSLVVQGYNLDIRHKKGSENVLADTIQGVALSAYNKHGMFIPMGRSVTSHVISVTCVLQWCFFFLSLLTLSVG